MSYDVWQGLLVVVAMNAAFFALSEWMGSCVCLGAKIVLTVLTKCS